MTFVSQEELLLFNVGKRSLRPYELGHYVGRSEAELDGGHPGHRRSVPVFTSQVATRTSVNRQLRLKSLK